jgi:hypothetical protein
MPVLVEMIAILLIFNHWRGLLVVFGILLGLGFVLVHPGHRAVLVAVVALALGARALWRRHPPSRPHKVT